MSRTNTRIRRQRGGKWTSTVTHNGVRYIAKAATDSATDAALSARSMKQHLEFLEGKNDHAREA